MKVITRRIPAAAEGGGEERRPSEKLPDTALLYSADDLARMAKVDKAVIVRLCLAGAMPRWREIDGCRYWDRAGAVEALQVLARAGSPAATLGRRKIA